MRGFSIYLAAGILVVLAMDMIAPPVGMGFDVFAWPAVKGDEIVQHVDRANKSDRLLVPTTTGRQLMPKRQPPLLIGCEPAFSPLSGGARKSIAARCVS